MVWEPELNTEFSIHLYSKSDDFLFSVGRMLNFFSNISLKRFYSAFGVEIPLIPHTTNKYETCCNTSDNLISRIPKDGSNINVFAKGD